MRPQQSMPSQRWEADEMRASEMSDDFGLYDMSDLDETISQFSESRFERFSELGLDDSLQGSSRSNESDKLPGDPRIEALFRQVQNDVATADLFDMCVKSPETFRSVRKSSSEVWQIQQHLHLGCVVERKAFSFGCAGRPKSNFMPHGGQVLGQAAWSGTLIGSERKL